MNTLTEDQVSWFMGLLKYWSTLIPSVQILIVMIGLDIVSGWLVAIARHKLNSTTSFAGMCKKAMTLILVTVGIVLEPLANGIPLAMLIAVGFIAMEGLSIVENAGALGLLSPSLVAFLEKLQTAKQFRLDQKSVSNSQATNINALDANTAALNARVAQESSPHTVIVGNPAPILTEVVNPIVIKP